MIKSLISTNEDDLQVTYLDGSVKKIPFIKDFKLGIKDLSPTLRDNIILRPRNNDADQSYFINFSGGLGDCLMLLEVILAFQNYLKAKGKKFQFILLITSERYQFFKPLIDMDKEFVSCLVGDNAYEKDIMALAKYNVIYFPSPISDSRVEHLSIGNFRDYTWALWGIPGNYNEFSDTETPKLIFDFLINSGSGNITNNKEYMLVYPKGFGKANRWKMWNDEHWLELLKSIFLKYSIPFIIFDAHDELRLKIEDDAELNKHVIYHNNDSEDDILTLACFFKKSRLILSIDTGPAHFAGFFKVPCIVLWGPTNPIFYQHSNNTNVRLSSCPPCFYSQRTEMCNNNICMQEILPSTLFSMITNML